MKIVCENVNGNYEIFLDCLNSIIGSNRESFLDMGCNKATCTGTLTDFKTRRYIDILPRELDYPSEQQFFEQSDILDENIYKYYLIEHFNGARGKKCGGGVEMYYNYSISFNLDCIEHLSFDDGLRVLDIMGKISSKQVIFTPDKEWMFTSEEDKDPEAHRSLWTPEIMEELFPNKYAFIHFPNYHPSLRIGAFYAWHCENIEQDFERVKNELKQKSWTTNLQVH